MRLTIRNVTMMDDTRTDIVIERGQIARVGPGPDMEGTSIDGAGMTALPGLHDRHIHLLATAARARSIDLAAASIEAAIIDLLRAPRAAAMLRATGYDERAAGLPDRAVLDRWEPDRPLRVQDRTGALWVLNSAALALLPSGGLPEGAERDASGALTGRFWRCDQWLAGALPSPPPDLAALGTELARYGVTAVTDAGAHNGPAEAALLAGALPQRVTLMGGEALAEGPGYVRGPLKLLLDERALPASAATARRIAGARRQGRTVAAHCVTLPELAHFLAALDEDGGARAGDRIEHGGIIPAGFVPALAKAGLTVVTNPGFLHARGDRYVAAVPADEQHDLYRAASLMAAGIPVLAASGAPYGPLDPWQGMLSACDRVTATGARIGAAERIDAAAALAMWLGPALAPGAPADIVLCRGMPTEILAELSAGRVAMTLIGGKIVYRDRQRPTGA